MYKLLLVSFAHLALNLMHTIPAQAQGFNKTVSGIDVVNIPITQAVKISSSCNNVGYHNTLGAGTELILIDRAETLVIKGSMNLEDLTYFAKSLAHCLGHQNVKYNYETTYVDDNQSVLYNIQIPFRTSHRNPTGYRLRGQVINEQVLDISLIKDTNYIKLEIATESDMLKPALVRLDLLRLG
jgi:hypothetical protein